MLWRSMFVSMMIVAFPSWAHLNGSTTGMIGVCIVLRSASNWFGRLQTQNQTGAQEDVLVFVGCAVNWKIHV